MLALPLAACTGNEEPLRTVAREKYFSPSCWVDADGALTSFLFYTAGQGRAILYPISGRCLAEPEGRGLALATIRQIGIVDLADRQGALQRAFPGVTLVDSTVTDHEIPASITKVYYLRARATPVRIAGDAAYLVDSIVQLYDTNLTIQQFVELDVAEREALWRAHR